jgi:hypothetical protein
MAKTSSMKQYGSGQGDQPTYPTYVGGTRTPAKAPAPRAPTPNRTNQSDPWSVAGGMPENTTYSGPDPFGVPGGFPRPATGATGLEFMKTPAQKMAETPLVIIPNKGTPPPPAVNSIGVSDPVRPDWKNYLSLYGGSQKADTSGIDAQEAATRQSATTGNANIAGIYAALVRDLAAQQPGIAKTYTDAAAANQQAIGDATAGINAGYASASSQREALLRNLGMQDQAPRDMGAEAAQGRFIANANASGQTQANVLNSNSASAQDVNKANQTAAGYRGAEEQAKMQSQLIQILAQYSGQRATLNNNAKTAGYDNALKFFNIDNQNFNTDMAARTAQDNTAFNRAMQSAQLDATIAGQQPKDNSVATAVNSRMAAQNIDQAQQSGIWNLLNGLQGQPFTNQMLTQYGVDPAQSNFVAQNAAEWNRAYSPFAKKIAP